MSKAHRLDCVHDAGAARLFIFVPATAFGLFVLLATGRAGACENSMNRDAARSSQGAMIADAERDLRRRHYSDAIDKALKARTMAPESEPGAVAASRVDQVIGLARIGLLEEAQRQGSLGAAEVKRQAGGAKEHLLSALGTPPKPYLAAKLGEAEVALGDVAVGAARLEPLASSGLLPDARSWLALAVARLKLGNRDGAQEALQRAKELDSTDPLIAIVERNFAPISDAPPLAASRP